MRLVRLDDKRTSQQTNYEKAKKPGVIFNPVLHYLLLKLAIRHINFLKNQHPYFFSYSGAPGKSGNGIFWIPSFFSW